MSTRSVAELRRSLRALGLRVSVEAWDALAVAIPEVDERGLEDVEIRKQAVALARSHGFSHLAVELPDRGREPSDRATLPGD